MQQALVFCAMGLVVFATPAALPQANAQNAGGSSSAEADDGRWQQHIVELASPSFQARQRAFDALVEGGTAAIPAVVGALLSDDAETRARALAILERLPDSGNRAGTRLARSLLEEQAATARDQPARRARLALARLRSGWTEDAIDQIQAFGGTVRHPNPGAASDGFHIHLAQGWTGGSEQIDLLYEIEPVRWLSIEKSPLNDTALGPIARLTELRKLYLGSSQITGTGLGELAPLKQLEYLSLKQLPIDDEDLARLPELPLLTALGLDQTSISDAGLAQLKKFPQLEMLWLDHTKVTDAGMKHVGQLASLKILYLQGIQAPGEGLAQLEGLANLRYLSLKGATLQPDSLKQIAKLKQLETLGLDHTNVTDDQLADIAGMPQLRTLWLSKTEISDQAVKHLTSMPHLTTLYLHGARLSSDAANAIRAAKPQLQVFR